MVTLLKIFDTDNNKLMETLHHNQMATFSWAKTLGKAALKDLAEQQKVARARKNRRPPPLSFIIGRHLKLSQLTYKDLGTAWKRNLKKQ